ASGLHAGIGYTLSRTKDNSSTLTDVLPNAYDDSAYWGISDLDRRHVLIANWIYELPFMLQRSDLAGRVLGRWQITGVYQYQSGSPFPVRSNDDFAGVGAGSGNQFWNLVGDPTIDPGPFTTSAQWFNTAAFVRPAAGTFGIQPRNMLTNPATWNFDLGIRKSVPVTGSQQVQIRIEAFNVLNHPNWDVANSNPNSGSFGQVTRKVDQRTVQLALRYSFGRAGDHVRGAPFPPPLARGGGGAGASIATTATIAIERRPDHFRSIPMGLPGCERTHSARSHAPPGRDGPRRHQLRQ